VIGPVERESHRHAVAARRPFAAGGGACTVLVCRVGDRVELAHHAAAETSAALTPGQAVEVAAALAAAARDGRCDDVPAELPELPGGSR